MRIDRTHLGWCIGSLVALFLAVAAWCVYAVTVPRGPSGGSWVGLAYGAAGTLMIACAGFLGARKKMLLVRIGSLTWWMRGHLWLGLLSLPIIVLHSALSFGGLLTTVLMSLLLIVTGSGVLGALLQHFLPTLMTGVVEEETTYEQIERTYTELRIEAYSRIAACAGAIAEADQERLETQTLTGKAAVEKAPEAQPEGLDLLRGFYVTHALPYLRRPRTRGTPLAKVMRSTFMFETLRVELDPSLHETLDDLARICDEARQKARQVRLHRWLHLWLLVHVPLSMALLVLIPVHAVMALYY